MQSAIQSVKVWGGGGDHWESCFDAVYRACWDPFEPYAVKYLIVITDQPPHKPPDGAVTSIKVLGLALNKPPIAQVYFIVKALRPERLPRHRQVRRYQVL